MLTIAKGTIAALTLAMMGLVAPFASPARADCDSRPQSPLNISIRADVNSIIVAWTPRAGWVDLSVRQKSNNQYPVSISGGLGGQTRYVVNNLPPNEDFEVMIRSRDETGTKGCVSAPPYVASVRTAAPVTQSTQPGSTQQALSAWLGLWKTTTSQGGNFWLTFTEQNGVLVGTFEDRSGNPQYNGTLRQKPASTSNDSTISFTLVQPLINAAGAGTFTLSPDGKQINGSATVNLAAGGTYSTPGNNANKSVTISWNGTKQEILSTGKPRPSAGGGGTPGGNPGDLGLNEKIASFAEARLNECIDRQGNTRQSACPTLAPDAVGDGECTDLVNAALKAAGAKPGDTSNDPNYVWGVADTNGMRRGDIIQFVNVHFSGPNGASFDFPKHTAIVAAVNGNMITLMEQNINGQRFVHRDTYDFSRQRTGNFVVYRAQPQ